MQIWAYHAAPEVFEGGSALVVTTFQVGLATGAFLGGLFVDHLGVHSAFVASAVLALGSAAIAGFLGRLRTKESMILEGPPPSLGH
jgi:predicted MFS family arabinose efflux permease